MSNPLKAAKPYQSQDKNNSNSARLLKFSSRRNVPLILQTEMAECGLACMAMVASYFGHPLNMPAVRARSSTNLKGMSLQQLIDLGGNLGLASRPLKCLLSETSKLKLPCILHWDLTHFVVLTQIKGHKYFINDPALGKLTLSSSEFSEHFTGVALEMTTTNVFQRKKVAPSMRLSQLWSKITGLNSALLKLLTLSIILQGLSLASPYYMQWVVDEVLISQDKALLIVLALAFAMLTLLSVITQATRSWLILRLSSMLNMQMGANLLHHLLRLPLTFFETRHVGDIVSRFGSLSEVRERITTGLVETLVDGIMSIAVLIMMFIYSSLLSMVVLVALILYTLARLVLYQPLHQATEKAIRTQAKEQSNFLENIRGIQTIKQFGNETRRHSIWQNHYADLINSGIQLGKLGIGFDTINKALFGIENIIVIYLAAGLVIDTELSIGMVLAFMAYKQQFTQSASSLVEQCIEFRMLKLHLERISDIALQPIEPHRNGKPVDSPAKGEIRLENICFGYDENEQSVLRDISLTIDAGDCIAITGDSGCGKTTLIKIMLGLLQPTSGRILLDGRDIKQLGLQNYRQQVAAVMQGDTLLAGSIADNICFFDPEPDFPKLEQCAYTAAIHTDITTMTMQYNTLVGDMGSSLSGGQVQRLLLARALYRQPAILFMDEATSHLDIENESKITQQIKHLEITRIIIAHRPETINSANQILRLHKGKLTHIRT